MDSLERDFTIIVVEDQGLSPRNSTTRFEEMAAVF